MLYPLNGVDNTIAEDWVKRLHTTTSKLDAILWLDTLTTPDISVKFYGAPDLLGREQVEPVFVGFLSSLSSMQHDVRLTDFVPPRIYHQCRVHYLPKGGDKTKDLVSMDIQCVYHVREDDGELRCFRMELYGDPSSLNQKMREFS